MGETIQELTSTTDRSNTNSLFAISSTQTCYWYPDYTLMGLSGTEDKTVADAAMQSWLTTFGEISFLYVLKTPTETSITLNNNRQHNISNNHNNKQWLITDTI